MPLTSHFELEPLILAHITALGLTGLVTVADETEVALVSDIRPKLPAVILFTGPGELSEGAEGRVQTETQTWQLSVMVKHYNRAPADTETTASEAGKYLLPILQALVGKTLHADMKPLEIISRPSPVYEQGWAEFPVLLRTSFDVVGN